jgi:hypothetical protein
VTDHAVPHEQDFGSCCTVWQQFPKDVDQVIGHSIQRQAVLFFAFCLACHTPTKDQSLLQSKAVVRTMAPAVQRKEAAFASTQRGQLSRRTREGQARVAEAVVEDEEDAVGAVAGLGRRVIDAEGRV